MPSNKLGTEGLLKKLRLPRRRVWPMWDLLARLQFLWPDPFGFASEPALSAAKGSEESRYGPAEASRKTKTRFFVLAALVLRTTEADSVVKSSLPY